MTRSYDWITHHARTRPNAVAQVDLATDRTFTWAQMDDRTADWRSRSGMTSA